MGERVRFLGAVAEGDLPDLYRAADVFVMPSTGEGFGIAFIEAMACGTSAVGLSAKGDRDALAPMQNPGATGCGDPIPDTGLGGQAPSDASGHPRPGAVGWLASTLALLSRASDGEERIRLAGRVAPRFAPSVLRRRALATMRTLLPWDGRGGPGSAGPS
jgi:hypothetical protein